MFAFRNPYAFLLLILIPLFYILRHLKIFSPLSVPAVLMDFNQSEENSANSKNLNALPGINRIRRFLFKAAKFILIPACILTVTALADPAVTTQEKIFTSPGPDIVFVVDTSPSMAAKDIDSQTRISAAIQAVKTVCNENPGYRFGVVAVGSEAAVIVPPTDNKAIFNERFSDVAIGSLGNGSALGVGISTAVYHLISSASPEKAIVLLTDGENNAGDIHPETAAELAAKHGIKLFAVGIGSRGTVPIEYTDSKTGKLYSGYFESTFNSASIRKITAIGNGLYFEAKSMQELAQSLKTISVNENIPHNYITKTSAKLLYKEFLTAAIVFFILAEVFRKIAGV